MGSKKRSPQPPPPLPRRLATSVKLLRLLLAVYHPRNRYLLHLSAGAAQSERTEQATAVRAFGNVDVVSRPGAGTPMGSSDLAAALLRLDSEWDWFITLSAADYPLLTQDGVRRRGVRDHGCAHTG
jgi:hypothetical protein